MNLKSKLQITIADNGKSFVFSDNTLEEYSNSSNSIVKINKL
jgi:hypothetical protein